MVRVDALDLWQERRTLAAYSAHELRLRLEEGIRSGQPRPLAADTMERIRESVVARFIMAGHPR